LFGKKRNQETMMDTMRIEHTVTTEGEILVRGLPLKRGDKVELIVLHHAKHLKSLNPNTVGQLRHSGVIGMWKDREDIADSAIYARRLRETAETRREPDASA